MADIGVRATPEMLADLLVTDLSNDGTRLRKEIPRILKELVKAGKLIKLDEEYGLQTRESSEWDREFRNRQTRLNSDLTSLSSKRCSLISAACGDALKGIKLTQGDCKEPRKLLIHFGTEPPPAAGSEIPVSVRDGWGEKESTVLSDARTAGSDSPIIYVYIPKTSPDDPQKAIVEYEAAKSTLEFKGTPTTDEGREARDAMSTRMATAEATRNQIINDVIDSAKVFQGGGGERYELSLVAKVEAAAQASLDRPFRDFNVADDKRWPTVINRAKNGDEAALSAVDWTDSPEKHPVCAAVLSEVGSGKRGKEIRDAFEASPYGWPRDAVDAALITLHTTGHLRATHKGMTLSQGQHDQAKISVTDFRTETATLNAREKMKLRKLFQGAGISCNPMRKLPRLASTWPDWQNWPTRPVVIRPCRLDLPRLTSTPSAGTAVSSSWQKFSSYTIRSPSKRRVGAHYGPSVHCFIKGHEYARGGESLQECLIPVLTIASKRAPAGVVVTVREVQWVGLRCRVSVEPIADRLLADLRTKPNMPSSSITEPKAFDTEGKTALLVADESLEGTTVSLVIIDKFGRVISKEATTVGGEK